MAALPRVDGQDKVLAAAQHIVKSLATSTNAAEDMIRILSGFDNRLSDLCPPSSSSASADSSPPPPPSEAQLLFAAASEVVLRWDSSDALIFDSSTAADDRDQFLSAVDDLISVALSDDEQNVPAQLRRHADTLLQTSMARLEEEFRHLMIRHAIPLDIAALKSSTAIKSSPSFDDLESFSPHHPNNNEDSTSSINSTEIEENYTVELVHSDAIDDLRSIAERMTSAGYQEELCYVYSSLRRDVLDEYLSIIGVDRVSIEEVQRIDWHSLDDHMWRWEWAVKAVVHSLLSAENKLAHQIFVGSYELAVQSFIDASKGCVLQLLNFGDAVAICRRTPEKLFRIIGMYEALDKVITDLEAMFPGLEGEFVVSEAKGVVKRLGDAIRGTFNEFEKAVRNETSKKAMQGGEIHPLTRYVMNYIKLLVFSRKLLDELFADVDSDGGDFVESGGGDEFESIGPLAKRLLLIITQLESNIEEKSKLYEDGALQCIFLMNNLWYIVQKVKAEKELQELLGDHWVRKRRGKVRQYATHYLRHAWTKVLSYLKDDGLIGSGSSSIVSKVALKERFKNFNLAFEEIYRTQTAWRVPDSQLREELRISISEMVIPAYRGFVGRFRGHLEGGRHAGKYIKYTPEDLENHLVDLFEVVPAQPNHPRRKSN